MPELLLGCRRGLLSGIPPQEEPVLGVGLLLLLRLFLVLPGRGVGRGNSHCSCLPATPKVFFINTAG